MEIDTKSVNISKITPSRLSSLLFLFLGKNVFNITCIKSTSESIRAGSIWTRYPSKMILDIPLTKVAKGK